MQLLHMYPIRSVPKKAEINLKTDKDKNKKKVKKKVLFKFRIRTFPTRGQTTTADHNNLEIKQMSDGCDDSHVRATWYFPHFERTAAEHYLSEPGCVRSVRSNLLRARLPLGVRALSLSVPRSDSGGCAQGARVCRAQRVERRRARDFRCVALPLPPPAAGASLDAPFLAPACECLRRSR